MYEFLGTAGPVLESREAFNSLMLGICGQMVRHPDRFPQPVCLKTVEADGALVLAATMTPPHHLLLSGRGNEWEECTTKMAQSLVGEGWNIPGVFGPEALARARIEKISAAGGKLYKLDQQLRLYSLHTVEIPIPRSGL